MRINGQTDTQCGGLSDYVDSVGSQGALCTHIQGRKGRDEEAADVRKHKHADNKPTLACTLR